MSLDKRGCIFLSSPDKKIMANQNDVLQGTLDLLVLSTLRAGGMHGWGISQRIQSGSGDVLVVGQGSLYPSLHRLETRGLVRAEWRASDNNRRAKYYELTRLGRKALGEELASWQRFVDGVSGVLALADGRT
ncbi:MAG: PadR family transcriptional regulator [Gemmatimonadaceae bacterium]